MNSAVTLTAVARISQFPPNGGRGWVCLLLPPITRSRAGSSSDRYFIHPALATKHLPAKLLKHFRLALGMDADGKHLELGIRPPAIDPTHSNYWSSHW